MNSSYIDYVNALLKTIQQDGFEKKERLIDSAQAPTVTLATGKTVLNFCANNYLGLANDKRLIDAACSAMTTYGYGCASVRFICGTQTVHKTLEETLSHFLNTEDSILYSSCFDANGGVFSTLLDERDAIFSDELNHASIIDGIRLSKAKCIRYLNNNIQDLEQKLQTAQRNGTRFKLIVTDGVFSMDGLVADIRSLAKLAQRYNALLMVDDSHAVGFIGSTGAGTPELWQVSDQVDIYTGTFGKALGGASGGYVSGRRPIIELLRQRSRPYLFSNTLAPAITAASLTSLALLASEEGAQLRQRLRDNTALFRTGMVQAGFQLIPGDHPIVPIMLNEAELANEMATRLLAEGVYVVGFSFPVVPKGKARIRVQLSAAHTPEQIHIAMDAFKRVGQTLEVCR